jgi:hypothetical protein
VLDCTADTSPAALRESANFSAADTLDALGYMREVCEVLGEDWLAGLGSIADAFNNWRYALVLLWKFAVSKKN